MVNVSTCTVELWMQLGDVSMVLGGLLSSQELEL